MIRPGDTVRVDGETVTYRVDGIGDPDGGGVPRICRHTRRPFMARLTLGDARRWVDVDRLTVVSREVA